MLGEEVQVEGRMAGRLAVANLAATRGALISARRNILADRGFLMLLVNIFRLG